MKYFIDKKTFLELLNKIDVLALKTKRYFKYEGARCEVACIPYNVHLAAEWVKWVFSPGSAYQEDKNGFVNIENEIENFIYDKIALRSYSSAYDNFDCSAFILSRIFERFCTYQDNGDNRYYTFFKPSNNQILKIN